MMTLQEIKEKKRQFGYTNEMMASLSGVPLSTVQKVMSSATRSPRKATLEALSNVFSTAGTSLTPGPGAYDLPGKVQAVVRETAPCYSAASAVHTIDEIYALPDGVRAELMDGQLYYMASPTRTHQKINGEMYLAVANHIRSRSGSCEVYIPPFAVFPFADDSTYLEPDLTVVCDPLKLEERGCIGAPDWVVEILSASSAKLDCGRKLRKYREAGVSEYWVISPDKRIIIVYLFSLEDEEKENVTIYSFDDAVPCTLFPDLSIRLADHV